MDPTTTLAMIREYRDAFDLALEAGNATQALEEARHLVEKMEALDQWLTSGGFLPQQWAREVTCLGCGRKRISR